MARVRRGKKDANHNELKALFLQLGCSVLDLYDTGIPGCPDVVVGVMGRNELVEIKNPGTSYGKAGLNANQSAFEREWRGGGMHIVKTPDDVVSLVQKLRRK